MKLKPIEETIAEVKHPAIIKKKEPELIKMPEIIFFTFTMNGETTKTTVTNILQSLKDISKSIQPTTVKTVSIFHYELNNNIYHRILRVMPMKMLLGNNNRKLAMAKVINNTLGLSGEELYK